MGYNQKVTMTYTQRKKFTLVWVAALTFLAGAMNVSAILLFNTTISHHTGSLSRAAMALADGDLKLFFDMISYVVLFFFGAMISGLLYYQRNRGVRLLHSLLPIVFGCVLFIGVWTGNTNENILRIIAFGMGLQNGTQIRIYGVVVRTTHMTGTLTDAALSIGHILRGKTDEWDRFLFLVYTLACFLVGGIWAAVSIQQFQFATLQIWSILYLMMGVFVFIYHPIEMKH